MAPPADPSSSSSPLHSTTTNTPLSTPSPAYLHMSEPIVVLASTRVLLSPLHAVSPCTLSVSLSTGRISAIHPAVLPASAFPPSTPYHDFSPLVLLPGLVDTHVHLNEPGRTEWEGFDTGTRAAASGGVTTVVDMPLNAVPPTTTVGGLREKVAAAQGKCWVDVGFWGGVVPGNQGELGGLVECGVRGFKGFLVDSGVEEFPAVSSEDVAKAMEALKDEDTLLMFHAEMIPPVSLSVGDTVQASHPPLSLTGPLMQYATFLDSRPRALETYAIAEILSLAHLAPELALHIVHLSAVEAIPLLREARQRGVKITAETCFHYLCLAAEEVSEGDTRVKCCPPVRGRQNQDGLWQELLEGEEAGSVIQTVVSDHSPCTPELKRLPEYLCSAETGISTTTLAKESDVVRGDFFASWGGISSLGLGLSLLWTASASGSRQITLQQIVNWTSTATAAQAGLADRKGRLEVGFDGDVVVLDDEADFTVGHETMLFKNKLSAYEGRRLKGVVRETWLRGRRVFSRTDGGFDEKAGPTGQLVLERRGAQKSSRLLG